MSEGYAGLDAHAYVDNCLTTDDRAAFEAALRREPKLRARVEAWEAQNEAIRLAFGAAPKPRLAPTLARPSNENNASAKPRAPAPEPRGRPAPEEAVAAPRPLARWRAAALGALVFIGALVGFAGGPNDPRLALAERAAAALRAASAYADVRLDFVSDDPRAVSAWLQPRFARLEPQRLAPPGWSLLGVRIVPGLSSPAALVLYEDAIGGRAGLLLERTDASPPLEPLGGRNADETAIAGVEDGFAYAAVGPSRSGVGALAPEGD